MTDSPPPAPGDKPVDVIEHLDKIQALPVHFVVQGEPGSQFGLPHLKFRCPRCFVPAALSGPGKYLCPHCGTVSEVKGGSPE